MRRIVYAACGVTLILGLFFVFVWAPHPWGWQGFDHYDQLALVLAHGGGFPTFEVPWGYAYFLATFYRLFGDHPAIPLLAQVALNSFVPLLVFVAARAWFDTPVATVAAVLAGLCSFNTVYASTQSSDAVCTVLFMLAIVAFIRARRDNSWPWFAVVGLLTGLASQFRPNLILVPLVLAIFALLERRTLARGAQTAMLLACAAAALAPWTVRNYRLTGLILPTTVHGAVQLWYGTLQTGEHVESRAHNPQSVFEAPVFDATSLDRVPIVVDAQPKACADTKPTAVTLTYWLDVDGVPRDVAPAQMREGVLTFDIPPPRREAVIYYYFTSRWPPGHRPAVQMTPAEGRSAPSVYFVTTNHLGDADVHGDLLDIFDVVRLVRRDAWNEPLPFADRLHAAGVDSVGAAVARLASAIGAADDAEPALTSFERDEDRARLTFVDRSIITVPRVWEGRITEVGFEGALAEALMHPRLSLASLSLGTANRRPSHEELCAQLEGIEVNQVYFRKEPQMMGRYMALAVDNIRRDPFSFLIACAYRAIRLFVVAGTTDRFTAQQFGRSRVVYAAATIVSSAYLLLFVAGVVLSWRRGDDLLLPLVLILYIPITLAPVLTNMRYTVTVQPLVFMFVAVTLTTVAARHGRQQQGMAARGHGGTRTARQL